MRRALTLAALTAAAVGVGFGLLAAAAALAGAMTAAGAVR